jgi:hypothetical protein
MVLSALIISILALVTGMVMIPNMIWGRPKISLVFGRQQVDHTDTI